MFDSEVHEVMNPSPKLVGPTGSDQLDLMLSSAEGAYERARAGSLQLKPLISQGSEGGDIVLQAVGLISGELSHARLFLSSASEYLESRQRQAKRDFDRSTPRPANVPVELIVQRIHSLELLFDSLKSKDIMQRIDQEMKNADETSQYILRGGERWIGAYLESRQLSELDLVYYIRQNCGILETDLVKSCDELLTLPPLFAKFEETKQAIETAFQNLPMEVLKWAPGPRPFQANSLTDNTPATMGSVREEIRKLIQSQGGFFNPR